jgi:hypothetical protein
VDLTQALTTTTDGLIRGNARGLQAIGIHLNIKDAVSQAAEAMGQDSRQIADNSRLRAYYNELLQETDRRVKALPQSMGTLEDATVQAKNVWRGYLLSFGEAITRSGVVQEILRRVSNALLSMSLNRTQIENLALSVNRFIISVVKGFGQLMDFLGIVATIWDAVWGAIKVVVYSAGSMIASALAVIMLGLTKLCELLGKLPGATGQFFSGAARGMGEVTKVAFQAVEVYTKGVTGAFNGFDQNRQKLHGLGQSALQLATDLEKFSGSVLRGTIHTGDLGDAARKAAADQEKLNQQLKTYNELMLELEGKHASAYEKAFLEYIAYVRKIDELNLVDAQKRAAAKAAALTNFLATVRDIGEKEREEELKHQADLAQIDAEANKRRGEQFLAFWKQIYLQSLLDEQEAEKQRREEAAKAISASEGIGTAVRLSQQGKIGHNVGAEASQYQAQVQTTMQNRLDELNGRGSRTPEEINEIVRLTTALEKLQRMKLTPLQQQMADLHESLMRLNQAKMDPFHQTLLGLKEASLDFASQGTQAFAAFFSDIVSGQEGAGKKLLAAFLDMIGQMLVRMGTMLVMSGIAEVALAHTLVGRMMGASTAAGIKAIATGAILAAAGGILMGAASSLTQNSQSNASASASSSQSVQQPATSTQPQVIQVGAPGRAQDAGAATASKPEPLEVCLKVESNDSHIVRVVQNNVSKNGKLRVAIQNA